MSRKAIGALLVAATVGAGGTASYLVTTKPAYEADMHGYTGLFGRAMKFSIGVDTAMARVKKAYPTVVTYPHKHWEWQSTVPQIIATYKKTKRPVILSGHSLGADALMNIAHALDKEGVPVAALFAYDPTPFVACVPSNVQVVIGWRNTFPFQLGGGQIHWCQNPPKGSPRSMARYDVPDFHTNIDDRPDVHATTVKHVGDVIHMLREMKATPTRAETMRMIADAFSNLGVE